MKNRDQFKEMSSAISRWRSSKLTQAEFCKRHGYSASKFKYWVKKINQHNKLTKTKKQDFIPITLSTEASEPDFNFEIHFPNGVKVTCPSNCDISKLRTLIN